MMTPIQLTRSVRSLNRLRLIAQVLTRHGFGFIVAQINLTRFVPVWMLGRKAMAEPPQQGGSEMGRRLAQVCTELGPTFVKLGQIMSTRLDLVPPEVAIELRSLQDEVPPFDSSVAMDIIERELSRPVSECFSSIGDEPIASASIGQVYRAKGLDGANLIVKVQRPDVAEVIRLDMHLLAWLAESLEGVMPELRMYHPTMLVDELDRMLTRELDYINEAATTQRIGHAFRNRQGVRVPEVVWSLSGPRVLTMHAIAGRNLDVVLAEGDDSLINRPLIGKRLIDCYLEQIFELGVFHADPHPGNILVEPPASVALIDFGQVGTITQSLMDDLVVLIYACANNEFDAAVDTLADMGALGEHTDRRNLCRSLQEMAHKYAGLPVKRLDFSTLFAEFSDVMRRHDVVVPRDLAGLIKALSTLGVVATKLSPDLNLLEHMTPRIKRLLTERISPAQIARSSVRLGWDVLSILRRAPGQIRETLRRMSTGRIEINVRHENIERLIREIDRSGNRLAFAVVIAAIIIGSSVVLGVGSDTTVLGIEVRYIGVAGFLMAGVLGLGLGWAIFRSGRLH